MSILKGVKLVQNSEYLEIYVKGSQNVIFSTFISCENK
jgi:hypothetical protein